MGNGENTDRPALDDVDQPGGRSDREPELLFGGGLVLGAIILGLAWVMVSVLGGKSDEVPDNSAGRDHASVANPLAGSTGNQQAEPSPLQRCTDASYALRGPLAAAGPAMDQWAVHIGAMNKLVVGAISLDQANAFWNQTRVGAEHHITRFRRSLQSVRGQDIDCPKPNLLSRTATAGLRSCAGQVDADLKAIDAARTAINTWDMHVRDMERLRMGKLSPAAATQMWLSMWQRGQQELRAYRQADRIVGHTDRCTASGAADAPAVSPTPTTQPSMDMDGMDDMDGSN